MAERRMFAKTIVLSDAFLDMPMSARCLYFTLGMLADDDGFVNSPKSIMRQCGASEDDMRVLLSKRFVLGFDTGVIVIKHWRLNNYLQKDRYKETTCMKEKATLLIEENGAYTEAEAPCIQSVYTPYTQYSIDKESIEENSTDKGNTAKAPKKFTPPTLEEVKAYCSERHNGIDAEYFLDYYTARHWMTGKTKISDWKACVRTWERNNKKEEPVKTDFRWEGDDLDKLEQILNGKENV